MHVLQYPVLGQTASFDKATVVNSCVKPLTKQIKIDFALNTASSNYDAFKGDQLAVAADGNKSRSKNDPKPTFRSGRMDKQSYLSSVSMQQVDRFCVGIVRDKEMYITPVHGIYQMRPSFSYFDKQDKRVKADKKAEDGDMGMDEDEMRQVTVKFARTESDKVRKAREKSYNFIAKMNADEPWCETMWYPAASEMAGMERQKIQQVTNNFTAEVLNLKPRQYVDCLIDDSPMPEDTKAEEAVTKIVISKRMLKGLPLADQLKQILKDAKMVPLTYIQSIVDETSTEKILRVLQTVGTLLRGNWVLQSELLYPETSLSSVNGVPSILMIRGREYVLYKFSTNIQLSRKRVQEIIQLPTEETKEILLSIAKLGANKKSWELVQTQDMDFEKRHPELVQRQELYWNAKIEQFQELENNVRDSKRVRKKSHRESK